MQHDWIPSTLGHGETMCRRCFITNREAAALGLTNSCDVPPPAPESNNDNKQAPVVAWSQDRIDDELSEINEAFDDEDEPDGWDDCGRWNNGHLTAQCRRAGSEECDWSCPIGLPPLRR